MRTPVLGRIAAALLIVVATFGAPAPARAEDAAVRLAAETAGRPVREVLGFLPYWELADPETVIAWDTLTEVAYFGVHAAADGSLLRSGRGWNGWASPALDAVRDTAHANGVRLTLTLQRFSWTAADREITRALLGNPTALDRLAAELAAEVAGRGADGVNLDIEPIPTGYENGFVELVRKVRTALDGIRPGMSLTFDATGHGNSVAIPQALAPGGADAVLLMGYDFRTASAETTGSISAIGGPDYGIDEAIDRFLSWGVAPGQLILGVPWYGRVWTTADSAAHLAPLPRPTDGPADWSRAVQYHEAITYAERYGLQYDGIEQAAWTTYPKSWPAHPAVGTRTRQLWFDNVDALRAKYRLVLERNLRGVGIWALGFDGTRPELAELLRVTFGSALPAPPAPVATAAWITIPGRTVRSDTTTFAPDGDGLIEMARVYWSTDTPVTGVLELTQGATIVRSVPISGTSGSVDWDGRLDDGTAAPVGRYVATVRGQSADGRPALAATGITLLRTIDTPRVTRAGYRARTLRMAVRSATVVRLLVLDEAGRVTRTAYRARTADPGAFAWTWDGRASSGRRAPAGRYRFLVEATTADGRQSLSVATRIP